MSAPIYTGGRPWIGPGYRGRTRAKASSSATVTLKPGNSNECMFFDRASGAAYTLPTPSVGLLYTFYVTVLQTTGANVVATGNAAVFLTGSVITFSGENVSPSATLGPKMFAGNGSSHVQLTMDGTTLGGGIGTWLVFHCISSTLWFVRGVIKSPSGTIATPFST